MTSVVEYQLWVYKIRIVIVQREPGLEEIYVFFEMET